MAKWPHTVWKDAAVLFISGNPLLPFYATRGVQLAGTDSNSDTDLTHVASYYQFWWAGTITLDAAGKAPYSPEWWADLYPTWAIDVQPSASPPYPTPWPLANHETNAVASGGFDLSIYDTPVENVSGFATQTAVWSTGGHTEGMRKLPGPAGVQSILLLGINYTSLAAGYLTPAPNITWSAGGYFKSLFGSQSTIF